MRPSLSGLPVRALLAVLVAGLVLAAGDARADSGFVQQAMLTAADGAVGDAFGARTAVAVSGDTMVVPSLPQILMRSTSQGAVYVFEKPPSGWADAQRVATLKLPPTAGSPYSVG